MKTAILALCLAALATTAEARNWAGYHCPQGDIQMLAAKYFTPGMASGQCTRPCDSNFHYFKDGDDPEKSRPIDRFIRLRGGDLFYKGKKCQPWAESEYDGGAPADYKPPPSDTPTYRDPPEGVKCWFSDGTYRPCGGDQK